MAIEAIPSSTVLLLRDDPAFEVLMVERHENIKFAGGALVFPGGRIDKGDFSPEWHNYADGYEDTVESQRAPKIAAIREAFEETGILLARHKTSGPFVSAEYAKSLSSWRQEIEQDDQKFLVLIRQKNLVLACDTLNLFAHWIAPKEVRHRRFETWFYTAKTPPGQIALEDGNEATEAAWLAPSEALNARKNGSRKMIFPTARNLELLNISSSVQSVIDHAKVRTIERVQPKTVERNGQHYVTIPNNLGYPVTEESIETAMRT